MVTPLQPKDISDRRAKSQSSSPQSVVCTLPVSKTLSGHPPTSKLSSELLKQYLPFHCADVYPDHMHYQQASWGPHSKAEQQYPVPSTQNRVLTTTLSTGKLTTALPKNVPDKASRKIINFLVKF